MNHTIYRSKKKSKPNPTVQVPEVKKRQLKNEITSDPTARAEQKNKGQSGGEQLKMPTCSFW
jgi:hypothetical protein